MLIMRSVIVLNHLEGIQRLSNINGGCGTKRSGHEVDRDIILGGTD